MHLCIIRTPSFQCSSNAIGILNFTAGVTNGLLTILRRRAAQFRAAQYRAERFSAAARR